MPPEGGERVLGVHPDAVVDDGDPGDATAVRFHRHAPRRGVDGVLDELLDDRRRPLDDLTRGDLVHEDRRKDPDARHGGGS